MPRRKTYLTPTEEVSRVLSWAEQQGFADEPAMLALRGGATDDAFQVAINWAEGRGFFNMERALSSTLTVAEFVRRGQAAQQAVDAVLSAERSKRKS
jgi:hypothetical protein